MQKWGGVCAQERPQGTPGLPAAGSPAGDGQRPPLGSVHGLLLSASTSARRGGIGSPVPSPRTGGGCVGTKMSSLRGFLTHCSRGMVVAPLSLVSSCPVRKSSVTAPILQMPKLRRDGARPLGQSTGFDSRQVRGSREFGSLHRQWGWGGLRAWPEPPVFSLGTLNPRWQEERPSSSVSRGRRLRGA